MSLRGLVWTSDPAGLGAEAQREPKAEKPLYTIFRRGKAGLGKASLLATVRTLVARENIVVMQQENL